MSNILTYKHSTPHRITYFLAGDGTAAQVIPNATLLADMEAGPLRDLFNATYANQAAMRAALLEESVEIRIRPRAHPAVVTAEVSTWAVDVDVDAVTATKPEINVTCPDQASADCYIDIIARHSIVD